uniref:Uncharacterized protein n=1 Tax=Ciona savignyi TaxID=51511 RepID=H2YVC3_CIOSA
MQRHRLSSDQQTFRIKVMFSKSVFIQATLTASLYFRSVILALLADPDTQSLVETVRLLRICIANSNTADPWVESAAENAKDLLENSIFILNSSTNGKLLANLAEVLDQMFKYSEKILETFC